MSGTANTQALERALTILEALAGEKEGLGLNEVARRVGLHKSTVYRLLQTFKEYGYVEREADHGKYRLGLKILELSGQILDRIDVRTIAHPFLEELAAKSNEVAHLVIPDGDEAVYIDKVEGNRTIRMHSQIGRRVPLHSTAVGKAILAYLTWPEVQDLLARKGLPRFTARTITEWTELAKELEGIRQRGYAVDNGENEEGIRCVGAPIFDYQNRVVAALSISGSEVHVTEERIPELGGLVRWAGREISRRLGFRGGDA
ncbi:IclR family transcriptional regulator [Thermanaeromonas sp. C210]|uniref:IclR family transcriptional regulator n=1 Tax=Thermanaeromonas sp. C210 TaxID=2731925 RepID=UPI00155D3E9D|nr:IclR family transcriptional regulator [Thermanaeromonas sp. C210]GFN24230.1 IclR family transcriptional regulator [Thermanaeromonas sp. C210]